jgi:hypothetical protein
LIDDDEINEDRRDKNRDDIATITQPEEKPTHDQSENSNDQCDGKDNLKRQDVFLCRDLACLQDRSNSRGQELRGPVFLEWGIFGWRCGATHERARIDIKTSYDQINDRKVLVEFFTFRYHFKIKFAPKDELVADDPKKKKPVARATAKSAAKPEAPKKIDDDEDVNPYGVVQETEAELREYDKHKPKFGDVDDKFKKSMRGPASAALVMPTKLMIAVGVIIAVVSIVWFVMGFWPIVFTDADSSDEEYIEAFITMGLALMTFGVGLIICYGAFKMQGLESYTWAIVASVITIPLLVGIYSFITLRDPKVVAGFQEVEGATDDDDGLKLKDVEDDDDEEDDEDDDD